jgi:hypothetical protein
MGRRDRSGGGKPEPVTIYKREGTCRPMRHISRMREPKTSRPAPVRTGAPPATHMQDWRIRSGVRDRAGRHGSVGLPTNDPGNTEGGGDGGGNDERTHNDFSSFGNSTARR